MAEFHFQLVARAPQRWLEPGKGVWMPLRPLDLAATKSRGELLRFETVDAATHLPLAGSRVAFGLEGCLIGPPESAEDSGWLIPASARLSWMAGGPGLEPEYGTERELRRMQGELVARVALRLGWGALVYLRETVRETVASPGAKGKARVTIHSHVAWHLVGALGADQSETLRTLLAAPVASVSASVMDEETAPLFERPSDLGELRLAAERPPKRIALTRPGWRAVELRPLEERDKSVPLRYVLWLERE
jgi:hypothetical protein